MMCSYDSASIGFLIEAIFRFPLSRTDAMHRVSTTISRGSMGKFLSLLITFLIALIALTHSALSQDTSKIPTLQLWFEAKGIGWVHYLQDYDANNGGSNAVMVSKDGSNPNVWYLDNGRIDTTTKPTPPCNAWWVGQADLNADGIHEIIDFDGNVFTSTSKGSPPSTTPIFRYGGRFAGARMFIDDFNGDGKQDILSLGTKEFCKILLGGNDLAKLQVIYLPSIPNTAYSLQYIVGAWRDSDGSNKMVVYQQTDTNYTLRTEAFFLYSFTIEGDKVSYTALDTTTFKDFKDKWNSYYSYPASFMVIDQLQKKYSLVIFPDQAAVQTQAFTIRDNKFYLGAKRWTSSIKSKQLSHTVSNADNSPLWTILLKEIILCKGNPSDSIVYYGKTILNPVLGYMEDCSSIGDVNNDGINDIAILYGYGEGMAIYLGRNSTTNVTTTDNGSLLTLNNNQPCSRNGILSVNLSHIGLHSDIQLTLYSLSGAIAANLGMYSITDGTLAIHLARYALSPGLYNLRCTLGSNVIDKALIITE